MVDTGKGNSSMWSYLTLISIIALVILAVVVLALALVPDTLRSLIGLSLHIGVIGLVLVLATTLIMGIATGWERYRMARAERQGIEHQSKVMVIDVPADHRVLTHEMDTGVYHNLSLDARRVIDGNNGPQPSETELRTWAFYHQALHAPQPRVIGSEAVALPEPEPAAMDILTALERTQRGLIVGPSNAGKSTILRWFAEVQHRKSDVVVIDPHAYEGKWPGCIVVGRGRRYDLIDQALIDLIGVMGNRYKKLAHSTDESCGEPPITLLVDEWTSINRYCDNASDTLIALLTESRKVAMRVYVNCHSDRVKSLGLDGQGDLREGFEVYQLEIDQQTGQRRGWLEIRRKGQKSEITPLALPGPFAGGHFQAQADDIQSLKLLDVPPDTPLVPEPGSIDEMVCQMSKEGLSKKQISEAAWGPGKFGSFYNDKIDDILSKYQARS